ncbi:NADH:ubiquinone oxidoreductase subunit [Faunimonas pinastri]|uniref:NADH:ubiquinone oxidoreductase subunit n=1 Tax=Faunimonas pinastri TaxID=1855383 RepID=A0A1H9JJT0_9HYPH|nr:NADH:ubiquinone oxidoreductase subunit NDUFA12 [Faunimonas pinastri]SEQ87251.1 NADH:ubiquinone oxidoreductase subunit [Faunimonas pinastri]
MKAFLLQFVTWWNGQTIGTRFYTWRKGQLVGTDEAGNSYYQDPSIGRRWVIYSGEVEASRIPPGWYGWMTKKTDIAPPQENYRAHDWQKPHLANLTGTPAAYRPKGSMLSGERRPEVTGDYDAWTP